MSTTIPCSARRSATSPMYTFMPPESPAPGWSRGDVCRLITAILGAPSEPAWPRWVDSVRRARSVIFPMVDDLLHMQRENPPPAGTGSLVSCRRIGRRSLAHLPGRGLRRVSGLSDRLPHARGGGLDPALRDLRLVDGPTRRHGRPDALRQLLATLGEILVGPEGVLPT